MIATISGVQQSVRIEASNLTSVQMPVSDPTVCQFPGSIVFSTGRSFVTPSDNNTKVLDELASQLSLGKSLAGKHLLVVGHTDSTGSAEVNKRVSEARAKSVSALLEHKTAKWNELFFAESWGGAEVERMLAFVKHTRPADLAGLPTDPSAYLPSVAETVRSELFLSYFKSLVGDAANQSVTLGCGHRHLLRGSKSAPSRNEGEPIIGKFGGNRRVDFFFFEAVPSNFSCESYPTWTLACGIDSVPDIKELPNEVYVSPNGNDASGDGTRKQPFQSVGHGVAQVLERKNDQPKNVILLPGSYQEPIAIQDVSPSAKLTIAGEKLGTVIVRGMKNAPQILVLRSKSICVESLILDGSGTRHSGLHIIESEDVAIENNTIRKNKSTSDGGEIKATRCSYLKILRNTIEQNKTDSNGGGIYVERSTFVVSDNVIQHNTAKLAGGGIAIHAGGTTLDSHINRNQIAGNQTQVRIASLEHDLLKVFTDPRGGGGGVSLFDASPNISDNRIVGNVSARGGGVECHRGAYPKIVRNRFERNIAEKRGAGEDLDGDGGGVAVSDFNPNFISNRETIELEENEFIANVAEDDGGGFHCTALTNVSIAGGEFRDNMAANNGGGLSATFGSSIQVLPVGFIRNESVNSHRTNDIGGGAVRLRNIKNASFASCRFIENRSNDYGRRAICEMFRLQKTPKCFPAISGCVGINNWKTDHQVLRVSKKCRGSWWRWCSDLRVQRW